MGRRKKEFYQSEPKAPKSKVTSSSLVQDASLGNQTPKTVPAAPGRSTAFGGAVHAKPHRLPEKPPGIGVVRRLGTLRRSGHPKAHRIGERGNF